jgi:hypothetical protein|tara:strand:+ start:948 stop:1232 length:285 start_codon:yes stop_codon:yes gene_type:complete
MTADMDNVVFTDHAVERFKSRYKKVHGCILRRPEKTARKLLAKALVDEIESKHRLKRFLNNRLVEASYYVRSDWRFIIIKKNNQSIVLTIERIK